MARYAFLLAVQDHLDERISRTPYCHHDAKELGQVLTEEFDFPRANVLTKLLAVDAANSPDEILDEIERLVVTAQVGDTILFYFAGHGVLSAGSLYLVLPTSNPDNWKATALPLDAIDHLLRKAGCLCVRIFDACHSGVEAARSRDPDPMKATMIWSLLEAQEANGWITFASCHLNERSYWDDEWQHGVFSKCLCDVLKEAAPGSEVDPFLLQSKVLVKTDEWCRRQGKVQTPTLIGCIPGKQVIAKKRHLEVQAKVKTKAIADRSSFPEPGSSVSIDRHGRIGLGHHRPLASNNTRATHGVHRQPGSSLD